MVSEKHNSRAESFSENPIVVPVEICGLRSCTLQKHGARKRSHRESGKELSLYKTNGGMRRGGGDKFGGGRGRQCKVETRNSLGADAPKHLYDEARITTLRASFESQQLDTFSISSAW